MEDTRLMKLIVFGIMDSNNKRGKPEIQWIEKIIHWRNVVFCVEPASVLRSQCHFNKRLFLFLIQEGQTNSIDYRRYQEEDLRPHSHLLA